MSDDLFTAENAVSVKWVSFKEIGDHVKGVYVEYQVEKSDVTSSGEQHVYYFVTEDGVVKAPAPGGRELKPMKNIPLGAVLGLRLDGLLEPTKKGHHPTKQIGVYWNKKMDINALHSYQGKVSFASEDMVDDSTPMEEDGLPPM
jgi:hypothetical protein